MVIEPGAAASQTTTVARQNGPGTTGRVGESQAPKRGPSLALRVAVILIAVILIAALITVLALVLARPPQPITGSGTIQAIEADVASKVPGRLAARLVPDGAAVRRGQVIARLDPVDQLHNLQQAQAALAAAQARVPQAGETRSLQSSTVAAQIAAAVAAESGAASSRQAAEQALSGAQANLAADLANETVNVRNFGRESSLFAQGYVSAQALDAARAGSDASRAQVDAAIAQRNAAQKQLSVADAVLRQEQAAVAAARANLESVSIAGYNVMQTVASEQQAQAAAAEAKIQLAETVVRSPFDGVVMSHSAEVGDMLAASSPVMTILQRNSLYLLVYLTEPDVSRIRVGEHVDVSVDGIPKRTFNGVVSHIDSEAQYTPSNVQTKDQRAELVFGVKVDLYDTSGALKPGLPADATFTQSR